MNSMHLFDDEAADEDALCAVPGSSVHNLIGVDYYLERRKDDLPVGDRLRGLQG